MRRYSEYKASGVTWVGKIPKHWNVKRAKFIFRRLQRLVREHDEIITAFRDGIVTLRKNRRTLGFTNSLKEIGYQGLRKGDLVIHAMDGHAGAIGVSDSDGKSSPVYSVCRTISQENVYYYAYLLRYMALSGFIESLARGIRERSTEFRFNEFKELDLLIPTVFEQAQIANFLDRKTGQIDELIRIKERRIELLQEQRTALINQAVTKGLDPNVEMKPSGVEWIGRIPKDWNAVPLTKYLESIIDYRGRTPEKTEDGRFLVTAKNIRNGQIDYKISQEFTSEDEYQRIMTRGIPQMGDVLFTTEAPLGEVANVDDVSIALAQRIIKFQPKPDFLNPYFLKYWILSYSFQSDLQRYATGSTAQGIKASKLCLLKLNLPPLKEQKQIVEYLDQKTQETNELIATEQRKIELLKEYRQSLISEVVTGKIDVRNEV